MSVKEFINYIKRAHHCGCTNDGYLRFKNDIINNYFDYLKNSDEQTFNEVSKYLFQKYIERHTMDTDQSNDFFHYLNKLINGDNNNGQRDNKNT